MAVGQASRPSGSHAQAVQRGERASVVVAPASIGSCECADCLTLVWQSRGRSRRPKAARIPGLKADAARAAHLTWKLGPAT